MRLIDADVLKKHLSEFNYDMALKIVDIQPTIEAEPVKRGRWEYDKTRDQHFCSMCGNFTIYNYLEEEIMTKHCPECGVEME